MKHLMHVQSHIWLSCGQPATHQQENTHIDYIGQQLEMATRNPCHDPSQLVSASLLQVNTFDHQQ